MYMPSESTCKNVDNEDEVLSNSLCILMEKFRGYADVMSIEMVAYTRNVL